MIKLHKDGGDPVQFLFNTEDTAQMYAEGKGKYPDAPAKCPHKECHSPVKMKKHGFYTRYVMVIGFSGDIRIRRYLCPACGGTVSMLPSFCVPRFQYGVEVIILSLLIAMKYKSVRYAGTQWKKRPENLTRRHILYYRKKVILNRLRIQLALNQVSPAFVDLQQIAGDLDWTREFLKAATYIKPPQFNASYHNLTGNSFMSLQNNVA